MNNKITFEKPESLVPNPFNPNVVNPDNFDKLKASLTELGFSAAVVVREIEGGELEILSGYHRTKAAIELGIKEVPVLNIGPVDDVAARKICLAQNNRYGNDDVISLAKIMEEIGGGEELIEIMPISQADIDAVMNTVELDLDSFDLPDEHETEEEETTTTAERPLKTHDVLKFRLTLSDAEAVRTLIEKTIRRECISDADEMSNAGSALAFLLLNEV